MYFNIYLIILIMFSSDTINLKVTMCRCNATSHKISNLKEKNGQVFASVYKIHVKLAHTTQHIFTEWWTQATSRNGIHVRRFNMNIKDLNWFKSSIFSVVGTERDLTGITHRITIPDESLEAFLARSVVQASYFFQIWVEIIRFSCLRLIFY